MTNALWLNDIDNHSLKKYSYFLEKDKTHFLIQSNIEYQKRQTKKKWFTCYMYGEDVTFIILPVNSLTRTAQSICRIHH